MEDVVAISELAGYTARSLARADLTVKQVADKLFLTADEARLLLEVCRRECLHCEDACAPGGVRGAALLWFQNQSCAERPASGRPAQPRKRSTGPGPTGLKQRSLRGTKARCLGLET